MWKLIVYQGIIRQFLYTDYQDYILEPWKEFIVPIEKLVDTYNLFHGLYGKEVVDIKQINNDTKET